MRLKDVLANKDLGLTLLAGADQLDRPVSRVYTTDLRDPSRYLTGGELVLTGMMWRRRPADSEAFVAALAEAGVAALGAGDAALGSVPLDLVKACRRHGLPLFEVAVEVSFRAITDEVTAHRAAGLASALGRHRHLMTALAGGAGLPDLLPPVARDLGVSCWVLSPGGRLLAGTDPLDAGERLAQAFLRGEPAATVDGTRYALFAAPAHPVHPLAAWLVACTGPVLPYDLPDVADELVSLVTLAWARREEGRRIERRLAGELLATLTRGEPAGAQLGSCGLPPDGPFTVLAATAADPELAAAALEEIAPGAAIAPSAEGLVIAIVPAADIDSTVRSTAALLRPAIRHGHPAVDVTGAARLAVGVSGPALDAAALPAAVEEARHAHAVAATRDGDAVVACAMELASYLLLLGGVPTTARRAFHDRLLGPLADYDRTHHADLVRTLDAFLTSGGSWSNCATQLHLHVNTLRYRIKRIEQLTGRNLDHFDDRVDFYLALRLPAVPQAAPYT
jgi:hypothetical protein